MYKKIDLFVENKYADEIDKVLEKKEIIGKWKISNDNGYSRYTIVIEDRNIEMIRDYISKMLKFDIELESIKDVKNIMMLESIDGFLPKIKEVEEGALPTKKSITKKLVDRISTEELYEIITDSNSLNSNFILNVILASIVCSVGIIKEDLGILIVATAIAPFLGAIIGYSFGISIGDEIVIKKSIKTMFFGFLTSFIIGIVIGVLWSHLPNTYQIDPNKKLFYDMHINQYTFILALASGASASLAITSGLSTIMASFMVSASLLPNVTISGILLSNGFYKMFLDSFLLLILNLTSIIFTSQIIFAFKKIKPKTKEAIENTKDNRARNLIIFFIIVSLLIILKFFTF